tara:strand:- start:3003 stop:4409 length:1407 start_codon:yes stop_codon:yes gene_type:complete
MALLNQTAQSYYDENDYGNYQFVSLTDIINQFMLIYVGEDKIIPKAKRLDVAFHAQRALAELSFDTFKSCKAQEIVVPASLQMILPQDYVNYTKISWVDSAGIKHLLYPAFKTSNPMHPQIDDAGDFIFDGYSVIEPDSQLFPGGGQGPAFNGNLIPSGDLIENGRFHGGSYGWDLNVNSITGAGQSITRALGISTDPITNSIGWFWDNNNLIGYNVPQDGAFRKLSVPVYSGEEYTITYTVSGYSTGTINFMITDENGDYTFGTDRTADGTYTETVTASVNDQDGTYTAQTLSFLSNSATALNATIDTISIVRVGSENSSTSWGSYESATPSENQDDYQDDTYWPMEGSRYGLDPQYAQANGSFYIDCKSGKIHFSSNISGKTVILDYISDSLGTDGEMQVHKFAEEAMYRWILHAIASGRIQTQQIVPRLKKEKFAAIRTAKLRLSNLKLEELTQILRGKSKQIKH